jgi:hypothetical protein
MTNPTPIDWKSRALEAEDKVEWVLQNFDAEANACRKAEAALASSEATVTRMREVLEPFAKFGASLIGNTADTFVACENVSGALVTIADFRAARDCLSTLSGGGEQ